MYVCVLIITKEFNEKEKRRKKKREKLLKLIFNFPLVLLFLFLQGPPNTFFWKMLKKNY